MSMGIEGVWTDPKTQAVSDAAGRAGTMDFMRTHKKTPDLVA